MSYSDIGGRPDSVQVMLNRRHLYVGTCSATASPSSTPAIRAACGRWDSSPPGIRPARTPAGGATSCFLPTAPTSSPCSRTTTAQLLREFPGGQHHQSQAVPIGLSIHDISKPSEMREIAFLEMPGLGVNRSGGGRPLRLRVRTFRWLHRSHPLHRRLKEITKPQIVSRWWLPGMNRGSGETPTLDRTASRAATTC